MSPFVCAIFLLHLSLLSAAVKFTQVYKWHEMDFEWPSEAKRTQALETGTYKPERIEPRYMAVYGERIFLSLEKMSGIPATLVSLPTSSASSAPPKLTPFPSWDLHLHGKEDCDKIEEARGLEVDSVGRLWVLDSGSDNCSSKVWTIDLSKNKDEAKLVHRLPLHGLMHDLVLDETPNGTLAYISHGGVWSEESLIVYSEKTNESWTVQTQGAEIYAIALSPRKEQSEKTLYTSSFNMKEIHSISTAALRTENLATKSKSIGNWTAEQPYRMMMDNQGTMYAAFRWKNHTASWNSSQPLQEHRFQEVAELNSEWPFTFALDKNGIFWMTACDEEIKPICRLLKAAIGAQSYLHGSPPDKSVCWLYLIACFSILIPLSLLLIWYAAERKKYTNQDNSDNTHHEILPLSTFRISSERLDQHEGGQQ